MRGIKIYAGRFARTYTTNIPKAETVDMYLIAIINDDRNYWNTIDWQDASILHEERLREAAYHKSLLNMHRAAHELRIS